MHTLNFYSEISLLYELVRERDTPARFPIMCAGQFTDSLPSQTQDSTYRPVPHRKEVSVLLGGREHDNSAQAASRRVS